MNVSVKYPTPESVKDIADNYAKFIDCHDAQYFTKYGEYYVYIMELDKVCPCAGPILCLISSITGFPMVANAIIRNQIMDHLN